MNNALTAYSAGIYYNPFAAGSPEARTHWLNFLNDATIAQYQADCVGQFLEKTSRDQIVALDRATEQLGASMSTGFTEVSDRLREVASEQARSNMLLEFANQQMTGLRSLAKENNRLLLGINQRQELQLEEQRITNVLLENMAQLLQLPESEKQRYFHIERGLKFFKNAQRDEDLYPVALKELLAAEKLMPEDYLVLYQIGMLYLSKRPVVDFPKAANYLTRAGKYAAVESHPEADRSGSLLAKSVATRFQDQPEPTAQNVAEFAAVAFFHAAQAQYNLSNFDEAVKLIDKSVELNQSSRTGKFFQAKYLAAAGKKDRALTALWSISPCNEELMHQVASDFDLAPAVAAEWLPKAARIIAEDKVKSAEAEAIAKAEANGRELVRQVEKWQVAKAAAEMRMKLYGPRMRAVGFAEAQINALLVEGGTIVELNDNGEGESILIKKVLLDGTAEVQKQRFLESGLDGIVAIAAGPKHTVGLISDGSVVVDTLHEPGEDFDWQLMIGAETLFGVVAVAAGECHSVALKYDGTVVAWGRNQFGQCDVPKGLSGVVSVAAGRYHTLALKNDRTVVAWGNGGDKYNRGGSNVSVIAAYGHYNAALNQNGTITVWSQNCDGYWHHYDCFQDVVAIDVGEYVYHDGPGTSPFCVVLKKNGTVSFTHGVPPEAWFTEAVAVAGGDSFCKALLREGTVWEWPVNFDNRSLGYSVDIPGAVAIAARGRGEVLLRIAPYSHVKGGFVTKEEAAVEMAAAAAARVAQAAAKAAAQYAAAQRTFAANQRELEERQVQCRELVKQADAAALSFFFSDFAKARRLYQQADGLGSYKAKRRLEDLNEAEKGFPARSIFARSVEFHDTTSGTGEW